jgi:hypothetical protein
MKTRYKVKGIGMEQTISSVVNIFHEGGKITKVQDKWNGKLPDGAIANVSHIQLLNPVWWAYYTWAWVFYLWCFVWWTRAWSSRASFDSSPQSKLLCTTFTDCLYSRLSATSTRSPYPRSSAFPRTRRRTQQEATRVLKRSMA